MPVTLTATLDETTVRELLNELLPLRIDLGDENHANRWFQIQPPQLIEFVPDKGIRIQTSAQLHWTVAGMGIPFTILSVRLLLALPVIDTSRKRASTWSCRSRTPTSRTSRRRSTAASSPS